MELTLASGRVIADPTEDDIREAVAVEEFAVLGAGPMTYIQCAGQSEAPGVGTMEYQDGSLDRHFRAADVLVAAARVTGAFIKYLRMDPSWRSDFRWEKMEL
jgi:hypothetical protein